MKQTRILPTRTERTYARHIRAAWERCDENQKAAGIVWYADARAYAARMAARYGFPLNSVAYAIAALSPTISWETQTKPGGQVEKTCAHVASNRDGVPMVAGYTSNRLKAVRCLRGDLAALRGPKVTAFARNILGHGDDVTVDRHAAAIAANMPRTTARNGTGEFSIGKVAQRRIVAAYQRVAREIGIRPCELQAAVWLERNRAY